MVSIMNWQLSPVESHKDLHWDHCCFQYVNDIDEAVLDEQIKLFADDTNLSISGCVIDEVNTLVLLEIKSVVWLADS